ncbi:MAG TPA: NifU family protein [Anaerolineales bacterium]|nr:NifU family protein [Anaerolineales bacterium]
MTNHENHLSPREEKIRGLIENLSSYIEYYHGGSVKLVGIEGNQLKVHLGGACEGCHLSTVTLKGWVSGTVKQFFPEIEEVIAV